MNWQRIMRIKERNPCYFNSFQKNIQNHLISWQKNRKKRTFTQLF